MRKQIIKKISGFTLIELLIALMIVGILSALAYPSFKSYIRKSRRVEAEIALTELSNAMERYYFSFNSYLNATLGTGGIYPSETEYYTLEMDIPDANTYTLRVIAKSSTDQSKDQMKSGLSSSYDIDCTILTLNSKGVKTPADCWAK